MTASARLLALLLASAAIVAGCGGDDSETSSPAAPATTTSQDGGASGASGQNGSSKSKDGQGFSTPQQVGDERKSSRKRNRARRKAKRQPSGFDPAVRNQYTGTNRVVYHRARLRCLVVPASSLARAYDVSVDDRNKLAQAYARREFPPTLARAAYDGCRDGLSNNRK